MDLFFKKLWAWFGFGKQMYRSPSISFGLNLVPIRFTFAALLMDGFDRIIFVTPDVRAISVYVYLHPHL